MAVLTNVSAKNAHKSEDIDTKNGAKKAPVRYPFWFGGSASCFATVFTHPLDLGACLPLLGLWEGEKSELLIFRTVKVRLQTQAASGVKLNMVQMFGHVIKADGFSGLYKGVRTPPLPHPVFYSFPSYPEPQDTA